MGLEAVVCIARDERGLVGLGEAVPRTYVTGETCESVMAAIPTLLDRMTLSTAERDECIAQRRELVANWDGGFPSCVCCAIDTCLLDLSARQQERSCAELLGAASLQPLTYAASIGMGGRAMLIATLSAYRALGFKHFKVKVGGDDDSDRLRLIRRLLGRDVRIFADANAVWDRESAIGHIESLARFGVWAIEEPLRPSPAKPMAMGAMDRFSTLSDGHYENYRWLRDRSPIPLIADESLICWQTAGKIVAHQAFDILNIRLSKCGGPWISDLIAQRARAAGLRFSIGAMVGETPILATAGANFAAANRDHQYVQGFSHRLLHARRFVRGEAKMRRGGSLCIGERTCGLDLEVDQRRLDALTLRCESYQL